MSAHTKNDHTIAFQSVLASCRRWSSTTATIRDRRLYKADFGTFEEYVEQRWEWGRTRAYQLIDAAAFARNLSTLVDTIPQRETHIRPLLERLETDAERATVWQRVVALASGARITAKLVVSLNLHRRHLDESQRAMVAAKIATLPKGANQHVQICTPSREKAAELLNVSTRTVASARKVLDEGAPELVAAVERGAVSVSAAADVAELPKPAQAEIVARSAGGVSQMSMSGFGRDCLPRSASAVTVGGLSLSTCRSNSSDGTEATRSAVLRWRSERPASVAADSRVTFGTAPP